MRKQHGVTFEAPKCPGHNEEMSLSRMRGDWGIAWEWYCPRDDIVESCCEPRKVAQGEVPPEVFESWGEVPL